MIVRASTELTQQECTLFPVIDPKNFNSSLQIILPNYLVTKIYVKQKILPLSLSDSSHFQCFREGPTSSCDAMCIAFDAY
jgi:hypothetical protein